jgi:hypothetical protein
MAIQFKEVEYWFITGSPNDVIAPLNRTIGQFKRNYRKIKIGITGRNPQSRYNEHQREIKWDRMVVIYETASINFANTIEQWLTEDHWPYLVNKKLGGGSELSKYDKNYVYVLLKGKFG